MCHLPSTQSKKMHCYLTPKCVLFNEKNEPKLTDFIFSQSTEDSVHLIDVDYNINSFSKAPEIDSCTYNNKVDCFSFGMIMYCIVSGKIPNQTIDQIKKGNRPDIPEDCDPKLRTMILDLWKNNPNDRPPMIYIIKAL